MGELVEKVLEMLKKNSAGFVVAFELFAIAWVRKRFLGVSMRSSLLYVTVGGLITLTIGVALGFS